METVRLRLVFDSHLSKSVKTQALKRCWVLLKPQHQTISDLSSHLLHAFNLQDECPSGLLLSMEGFALPPFESTSILKDKDIIRVEKNGVSSETVMVDDEPKSLEVVEIVETQPVATAMNLLANEEYEKESGGYRSEEEEDDQEQAEDAEHVECVEEEKKVSKKRKASKVLKSSKRKKRKSASSETSAHVVEDNGNNVHEEQNGTLATAKVNTKRLCQAQENCNGDVDALPTPNEDKKLPSRSARRKKAKRRWLREKQKAERKELRQRKLPGKFIQLSSQEGNQRVSAEKGTHEVFEEVPEKDNGKLPENKQVADQDNGVEEDFVPIVIRPGHIRFEPLEEGSTDQTEKRNQAHWENFQWNGITNKKKGQKWGMEKASSSKRNECKNANQDRSKKLNNGVRPGSRHIDFEKLEFYTTLPNEGDVIAYRLIELSSSWTPELSSYRVGKIKRYEMSSNRVWLLQVPGYPIFVNKEMDDDESALPPEISPYASDGSLWMEFSSLIEVRHVIKGKSNSANFVADGVDKVWVEDQENGTNSTPATHASSQENGQVNPWEEINHALNAKKEQLTQENKWNNAESSSGKSWPYKTLRGSALGPTMALLRTQNEI